MPRTSVILLAVGSFVLPASALAQAITMDRLWPNEDGRSWIYDQHYVELIFGSRIVDNQIRLFFDGPTVAPNGIAAQYLRQEVVSGPSTRPTFAAATADPFLSSLWMARPDLRRKIENAIAGSPCPAVAPAGGYPLLGGEFAYARRAPRSPLAMQSRDRGHGSGGLGPHDRKHLHAAARPGLREHVYLHGTIAASKQRTFPPAASPAASAWTTWWTTAPAMHRRLGNPVGTFRSRLEASSATLPRRDRSRVSKSSSRMPKRPAAAPTHPW